MTSSAIKTVHAALAETLVPLGFKKKGSSWYCVEPEAILVINPQRSQYSARFYLNLGIYWRSLGEETAPQEHHCHMRGRISAVIGHAAEKEVERVLDFEDLSIDEVTRRAVLRDCLAQHAVPLLQRCSTAAGLREEHQKGTLKSFLLSLTLAETLGLK